MHPSLKLLTDGGWKMTMIEDQVQMVQKDDIALFISNMLSPDFPCQDLGQRRKRDYGQ